MRCAVPAVHQTDVLLYAFFKSLRWKDGADEVQMELKGCEPRILDGVIDIRSPLCVEPFAALGTQSDIAPFFCIFRAVLSFQCIAERRTNTIELP